MRNTVLNYIDRFRHDRHQRLVHGSVLLILATVVSLTVYWQLRLSGITMTNETYCGYEEHTHTEECYEYTLICELEETEEHVHDETCYDEEDNLICGLEESERHTHGDECYETTLICELEEHVHTVDCLVNLEADVETAVDWEATLPELTGDLRTDIVNIAYSQIGYAESTANYALAEDGITHLGYTRYGAWYGGLYYSSEYSDWDSMFVAFCLDYAGVAEELTYNSGAFAWSVELSELGYYQSSDAYTPEAGDVVFIDTDLDGRADVTAIVVAIDETITVVQGDVSDTVALVEYPIDDSILGYANVTYTEETEDEEIALDESDEITAEEFEELDVSAEDEDEVLLTLEFVGTDYIITVSYGEDAALPEGTELVAYEYAQDSENFLARYEEAAELYGWDDSDETDPYHGFRLFNIGLYYDGAEIEPAAAVTVTVTYTGETDAASVSVTHFTDTATETLDATLDQGTDSQSVTFTADGFSEYGIMLLTVNATNTKSITELDGTETLYVEIDNSITEDGKLTAYLYYLDGDDKYYVTDDSGNYYISGYTKDEVEYTVTYTWYRSKEPYLATDATGPATAPTKGTVNGTSNYNYLLSTSSSFGATVSENYCTVNNGSNNYLFYYYYVGVSVTTTENNKTVTKATYETDYNDIVYATVDGAASYVTITNSDNTLTATLYDSNGDVVDPNANSNITYTYTWYQSQSYEAAEGATVDDAPYANTIADTYDYVSVKTGTGSNYATLTLTDDDSFYFYYVTVRLNYNPPDDDLTTTYNATAKGYEDWAYAGCINTSNSYTAVIVDNISSNGTFDAVLYNAEGEVVDTSSGYTFTWYKSDKEYLTTTSSKIYSDQTRPANSDISYSVVTDEDVLIDNTVNVAKDSGGLHYYKVVITAPDGKTYESAVKYVQYSDQIENGGFEYSSGNTEKGNPYWSTTNGYYSENHASYYGYRKIELGTYDTYDNSTSLGTYGLAYSQVGTDKHFVELNATEASTLYQTVITAPGTIYYWNVYHQNRSYNTSTNAEYQVGEPVNVTLTDGTTGTLTIYETTGTDSMYVIIMSDEDAEKLLAEVDKGVYGSQQDAIDAAVKAIMDLNKTTSNGSVVGNDENGEISDCYSGTFSVTDGFVSITLWQVTTTKVVTRVILTNSSGIRIDISNLSAEDSAKYSKENGWAVLSSTSNSVTTEYGYYQISDWVEYSGSYEVPAGQYLTRFFFAAASTYGNNNSAGNFIDSVSLTASVEYTIEYWVWDNDEEEYVLHKEDTETDSVESHTRVPANNLDKYLDKYVVVGSVTSNESGGENPTTFDSSTKTSIKVDAYTKYLSIYLKDTGATAEKVISGLSSAALDDIDETIKFTITKTSDNSETELSVNVKSTNDASVYTDALGEGTYTISESGYRTSLLNGKYLWVKAEATGTDIADNEDGTYSFTLSSSNTSQTITFTNYYLPVVTLKKVDSTLSSTTLSGVTFEMYKIENETKYYYESCDDTTHKITWSDTIVNLTTGTDGTITYSALPDGTYYLVETHAADGYNILTETLPFTISGGTITEVKESEYIEIDKSDTYGLTILVKNDPGVELPETGGISLPVAYAVGSLMILASAIGLVVRRKKI
ncbi:MAG: LPXTG cell wall anchor domain-containing protein [Oscillospiraceae bacterium]|nr:LPXTG cell wall anchor domain-containing protein [Oscillospiraceae bacterium]